MRANNLQRLLCNNQHLGEYTMPGVPDPISALAGAAFPGLAGPINIATGLLKPTPLDPNDTFPGPTEPPPQVPNQPVIGGPATIDPAENGGGDE
jgi:hypothetical protein